MQSWEQCALPVITTMALWQLMHLGTLCNMKLLVAMIWMDLVYLSYQLHMYIYIYIHTWYAISTWYIFFEQTIFKESIATLWKLNFIGLKKMSNFPVYPKNVSFLNQHHSKKILKKFITYDSCESNIAYLIRHLLLLALYCSQGKGREWGKKRNKKFVIQSYNPRFFYCGYFFFDFKRTYIQI